MTCALCKHGDLAIGTTTVALSRGNTTVVIKRVPAEICDNCGEYYLGEEAARRVFEISEAAVRSGAEVEILRYAA